MKKFLSLFLLILITTSLTAQSQRVYVTDEADGRRLMVDGKPFMVNGMNWDYFPIGTNFNYSLWNQPEDLIKAALDAEMSMLRNMGVNSVRMYTGVPAKWITYIYENYGIYTMLNHAFGRYGLTIDGSWMANTEYGDPRVRELLLKETTQLVEEYKNTPGLLLFLLGNENNYGLFWEGAETESIPIEDRKSTQRARDMYKLFNEAIVAMKAVDTSHPIAICNGDLLFLEIIAEEVPDMDIYGTNMYRGESFGDAFQRVEDELGKSILFTEFGSDAYNAKENREDQQAQAYYDLENWQEIYENAAGLGKTGNSIGGYTFQFSDGWWKQGQTEDLSIHNTSPSWPNGGYTFDHVEGENNMNEEWFGICAKGQTNAAGLYQLYPRAAYYALKDAHSINPYEEGMTLGKLVNQFADISIMEAVSSARGDKAALESEQGGKLRISELRAEFTTFNTGGYLTTTPVDPDPTLATSPLATSFPDKQGFDNMESYYVGVEARPSDNIRGSVTTNIVGSIATNPINEIFYENRARPVTVLTPQGPVTTESINRIQVYQAEYSWDHKYFKLDGFYRTGHYHWGYEGDFFGLYPEANYGPNIDIYNGLAPNGFEIEGKKQFKGLKVAYGRELWWAANPAVLVKYTRNIGGIDVTGIFHEDVDNAEPAVSSIAVPMPRTRRATLHLKKEIKNLGVEIGGMWGGQPLVGREFQVVRGTEGNYQVLQDEVKNSDTWGGKVKLTYSIGPINWYGQAASMGLVAQNGGDYTQTFTGWRLKESGNGNHNNILSGFTYTIGNLVIAPNFLWQRPLVDPIPGDAPAPARLRNIQDDPFVVRSNREMTAGEIQFTYDLTPGSWMYAWDNDRTEDAKLAISTGFVFRHLPTSQDAAIGILPDGRTTFAFPGAAPAEDLWEAYARIVSKLNPDLGMIANVYGGTGQARGSDERLITRYGGDFRVIYKRIKINSFVKIDDWGPFDYHRDFNLTFPLQVMADISTTVGKPDWFILPSTQLGVMFNWRSLDRFSPRYIYQQDPTSPDAVAPPAGVGLGNEWEIRTYVHINIGR